MGMSLPKIISRLRCQLQVLTYAAETIINRHPMIQSCVIFGRGRFQAGVLVEPKPESAFDPSDREKLAAFRNAIWYVELFNLCFCGLGRVLQIGVIIGQVLRVRMTLGLRIAEFSRRSHTLVAPWYSEIPDSPSFNLAHPRRPSIQTFPLHVKGDLTAPSDHQTV
jgi:hypothetical protein